MPDNESNAQAGCTPFVQMVSYPSPQGSVVLWVLLHRSTLLDASKFPQFMQTSDVYDSSAEPCVKNPAEVIPLSGHGPTVGFIPPGQLVTLSALTLHWRTPWAPVDEHLAQTEGSLRTYDWFPAHWQCKSVVSAASTTAFGCSANLAQVGVDHFCASCPLHVWRLTVAPLVLEFASRFRQKLVSDASLISPFDTSHFCASCPLQL